jgi:hypothetical protein
MAALYFVVLELERILPLDSFTFIKECVNQKRWNMGDVCCTCEKPFKKVIGLRLPKKVILREVNVKGKEFNMPFCDDCRGVMHSIDGFNKIWPSLREIFRLDPKFIYEEMMYIYHFRGIRRGLCNFDFSWDPKKKYEELEKKQTYGSIYGNYNQIENFYQDSDTHPYGRDIVRMQEYYPYRGITERQIRDLY